MLNPEILNKPLHASHLPPGERLVAVWARFEFAKTGHFPTDSEIADAFPRFKESVDDILVRAGLRIKTNESSQALRDPETERVNNRALSQTSTLPKTEAIVIPEETREGLAENERSFFMGLSFGNYQRRPSGYFSGNDLLIATRSPKPSGIAMLKATLGRYKRDELDSGREYKVYVNHDEFGFFKKPNPSSIPIDRDEFPPFALGILAGKLTKKERRITFGKNRGLLANDVDFQFYIQFGFHLGPVSTYDKGKPSEVTLIHVKDIERVLETLGNEQSVSSLSFFEDVKSLILAKTPATA